MNAVLDYYRVLLAVLSRNRERLFVVEKVYEKPPIIEALCQLRFTSSTPLDWTIPGRMYTFVQEAFPTVNQVTSLATEIETSEQKIVQQTLPMMQFIRRDNAALLQVAPNILSIHQLSPYEGWNVFKEMILHNIHLYQEVVHPVGINRIGLRYINRIEIPEDQESIQLGDYFHILPHLPDPIPNHIPSFLLRVDIPYQTMQGTLRLGFGSVLAPDGTSAYMLDLDMFALDEAVPETDVIQAWIEAAHTQVQSAFEAVITDKSRIELFKEIVS